MFLKAINFSAVFCCFICIWFCFYFSFYLNIAQHRIYVLLRSSALCEGWRFCIFFSTAISPCPTGWCFLIAESSKVFDRAVWAARQVQCRANTKSHKLQSCSVGQEESKWLWPGLLYFWGCLIFGFFCGFGFVVACFGLVFVWFGLVCVFFIFTLVLLLLRLCLPWHFFVSSGSKAATSSAIIPSPLRAGRKLQPHSSLQIWSQAALALAANQDQHREVSCTSLEVPTGQTWWGTLI